MLASLSQKVQRKAEEYGITMVTCCDCELPRGQWATEKPLGSSPSGTCCCFLLNHLKNDPSHKVKEAITLLYYKEWNGSLWALPQPFVRNLEKGFPMSGWKITLAREKRFYKCQAVQQFIISLFAPILSSCSFVFHPFRKRGGSVFRGIREEWPEGWRWRRKGECSFTQMISVAITDFLTKLCHSLFVCNCHSN